MADLSGAMLRKILSVSGFTLLGLVEKPLPLPDSIEADFKAHYAETPKGAGHSVVAGE